MAKMTEDQRKISGPDVVKNVKITNIAEEFLNASPAYFITSLSFFKIFKFRWHHRRFRVPWEILEIFERFLRTLGVRIIVPKFTKFPS